MAERGEVAGVEDAYIHFNNLGGSTFDIMVGQFQTSDPLMKRELRLTYEDYLIYKTKVGDSQTNLTYDRGVMVTYGIESTGTDLVGMVVNGNGKPEAGEDRKFDHDKYKNFGFRIIQDIGESLPVGYYFTPGRNSAASATKNKVLYHGPDWSGQRHVRPDLPVPAARTPTRPSSPTPPNRDRGHGGRTGLSPRSGTVPATTSPCCTTTSIRTWTPTTTRP